VLTADLTNPTSTSSGVFGAQVLTLKLNVALSGYGGLYYCNGASDSLSGMTIAQILAAMETALGGGALPAGYTLSGLNELADNLSTKTFHECKVGPFAAKLSWDPCP